MGADEEGLMATAAEVVEAHRRATTPFTADGIASRTLDMGEGPTVVCIHGVPASSFLYRKVVPELDKRGLRGVAFDLPGLGFADRPADHDYSWTGLGRFATAALDALELDEVHLVVHDIGGPVGFEVLHNAPDRIASLTILNTLVDVASFRKPWPMRPFEVPRVGEAWLAGMIPPAFRVIMRMLGIHDMSAVTKEELAAWLVLLRGDDRGRAFLQIMRSFETTQAKQDTYAAAISNHDLPKQVIWGEHDPALSIDTHGEAARRVAEVDVIHRLPGKHFLQEDNAGAIADLVAAFVADA